MVTIKRIARFSTPRSLRNWLRSPTKSAAWAWDETKYALRSRHIFEVRPGWRLVCHPAAYRFAYSNQFADSDQVSELDGFIGACRPGMVLFDIGAHFGIFSLAALHYGGANAKAIAVDPSPTASRILRIQSELNKVADRLKFVQASVGDKLSSHEMIAVGVIAAGYYLTPGEEYPSHELTYTHTKTIDQLSEECATLPTHVKIDVEGSEAAALRGGCQILSGPEAPLLFIELHNKMVRERNGDPIETLLLLESAGYQTFAVDGRPIDQAQILKSPLIRITARKTRN